uniref:NADH-ubiquinone oxidoreductase chain 6 n=1 Tax=Decemunciger sp. AB-2017 TaxID=1980157 RepID=A0A1X9ZNS0_9ANNE
MLKIYVMSLFLNLVLTLPMISSPLIMGLWVLIFAMLTSMWMSLMKMSWFGMILFLIYIGGLLVMFIYFVAITPNQMFTPKIFWILLSGTFILLNTLPLKSLSSDQTHCSSAPPSNLILYLPSSSNTLILMIMLLFIALIIVVKITKRNQGPLRPFKNTT